MQTTQLLTILACAALAAFTHPATAAPGDLDLSFGVGGIVTVDVTGNSDYGRSMALQNDGKIVVAGNSSDGNTVRFTLARFSADGALDTTFNGTGKVTTDIAGNFAAANSVAIQGGRIVVAGVSHNGNRNDFAMVRYNANGSLDTSLNGTGKVTTDVSGGNANGSSAYSVAIQNDGKIVLAGNAFSTVNANRPDFAVARYNFDGSLDTSFNGTGKVTTDVGANGSGGTSMALQSDDKIVVAGWSYNLASKSDIAVVRYNANGSLDTTFGSAGKVTTDIGGDNEDSSSIGIQVDGKIVVAGRSFNGIDYDFVVVRYNTNGSLDTTFGSGGKVTTAIGSGYDIASSLAIQSDGGIVVAGTDANGNDDDFAVVRYTTNGSLDTNFNGTGVVTTNVGGAHRSQAYGVAIQSDDNIVVAGSSSTVGPYDFAVVRYEGGLDTDGDGILDRYETGTGIYVSPTDTGTDPHKADTDGDWLNDGEELNRYHSNPFVKDTDGDGFDDGFEVSTGFSPTSATSTPDALSSIRTAAEYRFNAALGISYRIEASTDFTNWTTIETNIIGAGGVITRFYSIEGQPRRFFRSRRN